MFNVASKVFKQNVENHFKIPLFSTSLSLCYYKRNFLY